MSAKDKLNKLFPSALFVPRWTCKYSGLLPAESPDVLQDHQAAHLCLSACSCCLPAAVTNALAGLLLLLLQRLPWNTELQLIINANMWSWRRKQRAAEY